ncbi:MAG: hypothetical protein ABI395_06390 [Sphingobium sp.]
MGKFQLGQQDRARISAAVTQAEGLSDSEVVTIIAPQSDAYHDVGLHYAVLAIFLLLAATATFPAAFAGLAIDCFGGWEHHLSPSMLMTLLLGAMIALFLIVRYALAWVPLRLALTPKATKIRRVRRQAVAMFRACAQGRTRGRTAILIYLSLAEHRAEIVADAEISARVAPELWGDAMAVLIHHVRAGDPGEGMVQAIGQIGAILAQHIPKSVDNPDELPNAVIEL